MTPRRLPLVLAPAPDESLPSYVARMANAYGVPTSDMLHALGLTDTPQGRPRLVGYGTLLPAARQQAMQAATGLAPGAIATMLLGAYHARAGDLSLLDHDRPASFLEVTRRQWLLFRSSRLCPECLRERKGAWRLRWKLPWVFACRRHRVLLLESCPSCRQPHGHGGHDSCLPSFTGQVPEPLECGNSRTAAARDAATGKGGSASAGRARGDERRPTREPCGTSLIDLEAPGLAGTAPLAAQEVFEAVIDDTTGVIAGEDAPALEFFREARSLYALLLHHGRAEDFPALPASIASGVADFFAERDEARAARHQQDAGGLTGDGPPAGQRPNKRVVMYRRTLTDVGVMAALAPTITGLLAAPSLPELSQAMQPLALRIYERHGGRLGLQQYYGVSPRLEAALLAAMPRRRSRLWVRSELHRLGVGEDGAAAASAVACTGGAAAPQEFARQVPQLLWPDVWARYFAPLLATRADWPARRFLSMLLVKLATQCSWGAAYAALGLRGSAEGVAVGYVNRASRDGTAEDIRAAADQVLAVLATRAGAVDYGRRRAAFGELVRIDEEPWRNVLARADARDTHKRRYCAAIWLWSELTGGYPSDAPGWIDTPARAREMYRQFLVTDLPALRDPLLDHGRALLAQAGDAHPGLAELALL